jgi:hypothetical protein
MFASIRRYHLVRGSMDELMQRVDRSFADQIAAQEGFVSYHAIDLGDGDIITVSVFADLPQAEASRELSRQWTEAELGDLVLERLEMLRSEIDVSRASPDLLEPLHVASGAEICSLRRHVITEGSINDLLHRVDTSFAEKVQRIAGFRGYMVFELGTDEMVALAFFRDRAGAEESDALAARFLQDELSEFAIERTETRIGDVRVSRACVEVLIPEHS